MVRECKICKRRTSKLITLLSFPANADIRKLWATFCKIKCEDLRPNDRLCSLHFNISAFKTNPSSNNGNRLYLKSDAVPTVFDIQETSEPSSCKEVERVYLSCCFCGVLNSKIPRFGFPIQDPETTKKWLAVCGTRQNKINVKTHRVCMKHFKADDFIKRTNERQRLLLNPSAVPSFEPCKNTILINKNLNKASTSNTKVSSKLVIAKQNEDNRNFDESEESSSSQIHSPDTSVDSSEDIEEIEEIEHLSEQTPSSTKRCHTFSKTTGSSPTTPQTNIQRRYARYLNDIKTSDCQGSKKAKMVLEVSRKTLADARKRSRILKQRNRRLHARIETMEATIQKLREKKFVSKQSMSDIIVAGGF